MEKIKKEWYKRWWAIVLYVFRGLVIIGNILLDGSKETTPKNVLDKQAVEITNSATQTKNVQGVKEVQETKSFVQPVIEKLKVKEEFKLGEEIIAGDFK